MNLLNLSFPKAIRLLLLITFFLAIAKSITLPFFLIYFTNELSFKPDIAGYIIGGSLFIGTCFSVYSGYLIDKINKVYLILFALILITIIFLSLPLLKNLPAIFMLLILMYISFSTIDICVKTFFTLLLTKTESLKAFNSWYVIINFGFAIGPALGVLIQRHNDKDVFLFAGSIIFLTFILLFLTKKLLLSPPPVASKNIPQQDFKKVVKVLLSDRKLKRFTLGSILSAIVYANFAIYLSQYLVLIYPKQIAYDIVSYLLITNTIVVITLQKILSKYYTDNTLMQWLLIGTCLLIIGLVGFIVSFQLWTWIIAMIVFSLGEIIIIPIEFRFVDSIAPSHLKGSYLGVQNLAYLGGALGPIFCGFFIGHGLSIFMFSGLIILCIMAAILYASVSKINHNTLVNK